MSEASHNTSQTETKTFACRWKCRCLLLSAPTALIISNLKSELLPLLVVLPPISLFLLLRVALTASFDDSSRALGPRVGFVVVVVADPMPFRGDDEDADSRDDKSRAYVIDCVSIDGGASIISGCLALPTLIDRILALRLCARLSIP